MSGRCIHCFHGGRYGLTSIMWMVQSQPDMVARCQAGVSTAFMGVGMDSLGICLLCGLTNVWCIHSLLCEILTSVWCMVSGWTHALTWINWFLVTGVTNVLYMDSILCGVLTDKWWDLPKAKGCIWPYIPSQVLYGQGMILKIHYDNESLLSLIGIWVVYPLESLQWNMPLIWR